MTKAKKALSLILAVVMMFGVVSVVAFANDAPAAQAGTIALEYDKTSYAVGDTITVTAKLTTDYYAAATGIPLQFDDAAVTYVSNAKGAAGLYGSAAATELVANVLTKAENKYLYVAISPLSKNGAVAQICNNVVLFTATFTAKTAIADTSAVFGILDDQKTMSHQAGALYVGAYETSDVTSKVYTTGQVLTFPKMQTGPAETNTLVLKDNYANKADVVIDKTIGGFISSEDWYGQLATATDIAATGFIYGIETIGYEDVFAQESYDKMSTAFTTLLGDEYLRVTASDAEGGYESTGTKIEVLDTDKTTVLETYYFIYFGDVNGDALVDINDAVEVKNWDRSFDTLTSIASVIACDYNGDTGMDVQDASALAAADRAQDGYASQSAIAADFSANSAA